jgi:hypothetical protein
MMSAQKARLESMRVPVTAMIHAKVEVKPGLTFTGSAGLTVGDWVEVEHNFSSGVNSGGGVGIITGIVEKFSNVKYILDGHTEKLVPVKRLTCIPMPFRREKAQLRMRSVEAEQPSEGTKCYMTFFITNKKRLDLYFVAFITDRMVHSKWRSMNVIEGLQYGLSQGWHKIFGWL